MEKAAGIDTDILHHRTRDGQEIDFILERDRQKILVEAKSSLGRAAVPNAIRDMLVREDAIGAVVLNNQIQDCIKHIKKPVLFLPHTLAHTIPRLWDRLLRPQSPEIRKIPSHHTVYPPAGMTNPLNLF